MHCKCMGLSGMVGQLVVQVRVAGQAYLEADRLPINHINQAPKGTPQAPNLQSPSPTSRLTSGCR